MNFAAAFFLALASTICLIHPLARSMNSLGCLYCLPAALLIALGWKKRTPRSPGALMAGLFLGVLAALVAVALQQGELTLARSYGFLGRIPPESVTLRVRSLAAWGEGWCRIAAEPRSSSTARISLELPTSCPAVLPGDLLQGKFRGGDLAPYNRESGPARVARLQTQGYSASMTAQGPVVLHPGADTQAGPAILVHKLRLKLYRKIRGSGLPREQQALLNALILGDRNLMTRGERMSFTTSGAAHLIAISGLHLGLAATLISRLLRLLLAFLIPGWTTRLRWIPLLAPLPLIWLMAGIAAYPPSCVRAGIMLTYQSIGLMANRSPEPGNGLALAGSILLVMDPLNMFRPGFQLSFEATAAVALLFPGLWDLSGPPPLPGPGVALRALFTTTLLATLITAPTVLSFFGTVPLMGVLYNLALVPLMSLLMPAALLGVIALLVDGPGVLVVFSFLAEIFQATLEALSSWSPGLSPSPALLPLITAVLCLPILLAGSLSRPRLGVALGLVVSAALLPISAGTHDSLEIRLVHTGHGNLTLITTPTGRRILIDGGPGSSGRRLKHLLRTTWGEQNTELIILTHWDEDHYLGAMEIISELAPTTLIHNGSKKASGILSRVKTPPQLSLLEPAQASTTMEVDGLELMILAPGLIRDDLDENNRSLVIFLTWHDLRLVFTGDMGLTGWNTVAPLVPPGRIHGLVVPHHGRSELSSTMISRLNPLILFILCAQNPRIWPDLARTGFWNDPKMLFQVSGKNGDLTISLFPDGSLGFIPWEKQAF